MPAPGEVPSHPVRPSRALLPDIARAAAATLQARYRRIPDRVTREAKPDSSSAVARRGVEHQLGSEEP
jgi:hypothetical protein